MQYRSDETGKVLLKCNETQMIYVLQKGKMVLQADEVKRKSLQTPCYDQPGIETMYSVWKVKVIEQ